MRADTERPDPTHEIMKNVCEECGAHCCKYGGAIATELEVRAIVESGYESEFEKVAEDLFITSWGEEGTCPYLVDHQCSIYDVRPIRCRAYPVVQVSSGEVLVAECPLLQFLSAAEIEQHSRILSRCPDSIVRSAAKYMEQHREVLAMRSSRFEKIAVEQAIAEKQESSQIPPRV